MEWEEELVLAPGGGEKPEICVCGQLISALIMTNITDLPPAGAWSLPGLVLGTEVASDLAGEMQPWGLPKSLQIPVSWKCSCIPWGSRLCPLHPGALDALEQERTLVVPSTSPCSQDLQSSHGLILHHQRFTPALQKALRPPSSANKPLQVILLGKPGSYINIHNVNCCNLKAGFPLPGPWVCAAGVAMCAEPLRWEEDAPLGIMVTTGLYCGFGFIR